MAYFILFIIVFVAAFVGLIAWMRAYDRALKKRLEARPQRFNAPKQRSDVPPYPTSHYTTFEQRVFEELEGKPVLIDHVLASCPDAWSLVPPFRVSKRTIHAQETPHGTAYLFVELSNVVGSTTLELAVCAPRPVGISKGLEVHERIFSWKEASWDAYYEYKPSDVEGLRYTPSILQSLCPEAYNAWLEMQEMLNSLDPEANFIDFRISLWETHIAFRYTLASRMGVGLLDYDVQLDLIKRSFDHMLALSMSDTWRNDQVQTQEAFMIHVVTHIEEQAQSLIAFIVEDIFDHKRVSAPTRNKITEIARARDRDGSPALLNEIRKRWDARAPDGLTMVEHHDAQGGLTATTPDGGLNVVDRKE